MLSFVRKILRDFSDDGCGVRAAALAYYTIFALPPLLILLIMLVGLVWDPAEVQRALETQFSNMVGPEGGRAIRDMLAHAQRPGSGGVVTTTLGHSAADVRRARVRSCSFRRALNRAWEVKPDPSQGGVKRFIMKRLLSLGMILGVAFLLIVSLVVSALLGALSTKVAFPQRAFAVMDLGAVVLRADGALRGDLPVPAGCRGGVARRVGWCARDVGALRRSESSRSASTLAGAHQVTRTAPRARSRSSSCGCTTPG